MPEQPRRSRVYGESDWRDVAEAFKAERDGLERQALEDSIRIREALEWRDRVEGENERLREALESVCNVGDRAAVMVAREALERGPDA